MGPFLLHCQPTAQLSQDASTRHLHVGSSRVEPPCQPLWCIHSGAASQAGGSFGAVQDGVCDPVGHRVPGEGGGGCTTVYEKQCHTRTQRLCQPTTREECHQEYEQQCATVYNNICVQKYRTEYEPYTETECTTEYKEDCQYEWKGG